MRPYVLEDEDAGGFGLVVIEAESAEEALRIYRKSWIGTEDGPENYRIRRADGYSGRLR